MTIADHQTLVLAQPDLHERLQSWSLDPPGASLLFARKLARDNGWSDSYAARVITEYRRFLYLAAMAGHPVCPSDAVDQAWHQHMLDSQGYWRDFCPHVLGQPLHHRPSTGQEGERQQLGEWYRRTLASYATTFGAPPPVDIWPQETERFRCDQRWRRVDASGCWILPKPRLPQPRWFRYRLAGLPLLAILAMGVSGCGKTALAQPLSLNGPQFLLLYGLLTAACLAVVGRLQRRLGNGPLVAADNANLSPLEMAYLAGEQKQVVKTSLLSLLQAGEVTVNNGVASCQAKPSRERDAVQSALLKGLAAGKRKSLALLKEVEDQEDLFAPMQQRLRTLGVIKSAAQMTQVSVFTGVTLGGLWLLGGARLIHGLASMRPVGFLVVALILVTVALVKQACTIPHRTPQGERLLKDLQVRYKYKTVSHGASDPDLLKAFALLGLVVLSGNLASDMADPVWAGASDTNGGADGGGGGCGGGCGGCGGCGG